MMKLNSKKAKELLEKERIKTNDDRWINHSICVGDTAGVIARHLNLDEDYAKTLGYIHDIGKRFGYKKSHGISGYNYILSLGYDQDYADICLTHSYLNNDINCVAGGIPNINSDGYDFKNNFISKHKYSIYEKIINLCDLMCTQNVIIIEKRLIDLIIRYGVHENTQYHISETFKLKKYFDDLLGYNLYDLFPEIKENL